MRYWCCLFMGLLLLAPGCKSKRTVERAKVTGRVLFQGQPLPGGRVTFLAVNGSYATNGIIDEGGNYEIDAPVGEVKISVDNSMVAGGGRKMGPPAGLPRSKQPSGSEEETPLKGKYVDIPSRYRNTEDSGLNYTVKSGQQTHDIELSNARTPTPGAPGM
jgi:hypothetical protein